MPEHFPDYKQLPLHSSTGCNCPFFSTVATRIPFHFDEVAIVSLAPAIGQFQKPLNGISMFD